MVKRFSKVIIMQKLKRAASRFLICVENKGYTGLP